MLDGWSVLTGIAGTLIAIHLLSLRRNWRQRSECQRTRSLHQIDSDSRVQSIAVDRESLPSDLDLGPTLGRGTFGIVYKGPQICTNDMSRRTVLKITLLDENEQQLYA